MAFSGLYVDKISEVLGIKELLLSNFYCPAPTCGITLAHVIIVKGDKDLHLKDGAVHFKKNADSSSPDDQLQHQLEEKEITTLCWASTDGSILAANKSRNNSDGHLLIYGGDEIGSDEVIIILTLEWSSGVETLKCVGRGWTLNFSGSFCRYDLATNHKAYPVVFRWKLSGASASMTPFFKKSIAATSSGASRWPLDWRVYNHTCGQNNRIQRV
ncbi:hypothetical protein HAX54_012027 [Datura stramonium]|uniref:Uncharacterized protein n=1 Tax=Datura stramonium TaxID=4076 RepID=A0ABS8TJ43_DATST|nr:hypothetical protein [Datura stramonium]